MRFNWGAGMRPVVLGVIALAPLIANTLYHRFRSAEATVAGGCP
jgi:hypothetical protein